MSEWTFTSNPATDCPPPNEEPTEVTPAASGVPDDCDADPFGTITVVATEGVTYTLQDGSTITGTIAANGTNTVTANLAEGYVLAEGAMSEWTFTSNPATDCPPPNEEPNWSSRSLRRCWTRAVRTTPCGTCPAARRRTGSPSTSTSRDRTVCSRSSPLLASSSPNHQHTFVLGKAPETNTAPCPPDITPFPAQFAAEPVPPTCDTDGALPSLTEVREAFPNVTFAITPDFDGPGTYTLTVTAERGVRLQPGEHPGRVDAERGWLRVADDRGGRGHRVPVRSPRGPVLPGSG